MDGKTHLLAGLATGIGISHFSGLEITEASSEMLIGGIAVLLTLVLLKGITIKFQLFLAGCLGYLIHLLLDSQLIPGNRRGIRILLPLKKPVEEDG